MQTHNSCYFSVYKFSRKLLLLLICCFSPACVAHNNPKQDLTTEQRIKPFDAAININIASAEELEKLSYIGAKKARAIIEYRATFGKFRKPEHLLLVRGISDKRFREIRNFIKIE